MVLIYLDKMEKANISSNPIPLLEILKHKICHFNFRFLFFIIFFFIILLFIFAFLLFVINIILFKVV